MDNRNQITRDDVKNSNCSQLLGSVTTDDNACVVCSKNVDIYSIGECDHPVCYECSTRMRVLCQQNECPLGRQVLSKVCSCMDSQNDTIENDRQIEYVLDMENDLRHLLFPSPKACLYLPIMCKFSNRYPERGNESFQFHNRRLKARSQSTQSSSWKTCANPQLAKQSPQLSTNTCWLVFSLPLEVKVNLPLTNSYFH